jgi:hypothetical protein
MFLGVKHGPRVRPRKPLSTKCGSLDVLQLYVPLLSYNFKCSCAPVAHLVLSSLCSKQVDGLGNLNCSFQTGERVISLSGILS